jgi:hypothetical protein
MDFRYPRISAVTFQAPQIKRGSGQWALCRARDKAHARRKLHDLYANHRSDIAEEGLRYFAALYEIEREARELKLDADGRQQLRQQRSKPVAEALRQWLTRQRRQVPDGSATRKAIDYSLGRWAALIRYLDDGELPIDNNHLENRIRPVALGRGYARWMIMRASSHPRLPEVAHPRRNRIDQIRVRLRTPSGPQITEWSARTVHNQRALRNCKRRSDGRYRDAFMFGGRKEFRHRSFIARSASTYMCVVVGLS